MITRRALIQSFSAAALGSKCARIAAGQPSAPAGLSVSLAHDLPRTYLKAVSPDGTKLCLRDWSKPYETFTRPAWPWRSKHSASKHEQLRVVEVGTAKTTYAGRFLSPVSEASFFADSDALFLQTSSYPTRQLGVVDLRDGSCAERTDSVSARRLHLMYATTGRTLLMADYNGTSNRTEALVQLELPDYHERSRTAYATEPRLERSWERDLFFSADRKTVAYTFDDVIVCRRADDLGILWTRRISPPLQGVHALAITADGLTVAAAVSEHAHPYRLFYTAVYDGRNGVELYRRPICGSYGMAISPDGKLLAVGEVRGATLALHIYGLPDGSLLASMIHGEAPKGRRQFLYSAFVIQGIQFTSDGRFLISSGGTGTKVWRLVRE